MGEEIKVTNPGFFSLHQRIGQQKSGNELVATELHEFHHARHFDVHVVMHDSVGEADHRFLGRYRFFADDAAARQRG